MCNLLIVCQSWLSADLGFGSVSVCVSVCVYSGYIMCVSVLTGIDIAVVCVSVSVLSKGISQLILLLTLCACWALADRPTASLFIALWK